MKKCSKYAESDGLVLERSGADDLRTPVHLEKYSLVEKHKSIKY